MRVSTYLLLLAAFMVVMPKLGLAAPCRGVDRSLSPSRATQLARAVAKDLRIEKVEVIGSFRLKNWSIVYFRAPEADEAFVFYSKDPRAGGHVTLWSGVARKDEEGDIAKWALANAPGIPARLAKCFAWYVTNGRNA